MTAPMSFGSSGSVKMRIGMMQQTKRSNPRQSDAFLDAVESAAAAAVASDDAAAGTSATGSAAGAAAGTGSIS